MRIHLTNWGLLASFLAVTVGYMLVGCTQVSADLEARPPTEKKLIGAWVGFDPCGVEFIRVLFKEDKTGSVCFSFAETRPTRFEVKSWAISGYVVICDLKPRGQAEESMSLRLEWKACYLDCQMKLGGAKRLYRLLNESEVIRHIEALRAAQQEP